MSISGLIILVIIGIAAGVFSGMFGIGGGIVMVPALVFFMGMTQHGAQGTSIGMMLLPIGILAAYNYYNTGNLNIKYGLIMAVAFIAGAYFGSKISLGIEEVMLKRLFGCVLLLAAFRLIFFPK